jgi:molecular chaperone GrpE
MNDTPNDEPEDGLDKKQDAASQQDKETSSADAAGDNAAGDNASGDQNPYADIAAEDHSADSSGDINIDDILDPLSALQSERDDLKDQLLRAVAEMENTRRRAERDVSQSRKYGHTGFARDLLSVVENLSRAVEVLPEERDHLDDTMKNLVIGVEMISRELANVLERHGITRIMPLGEKFDPSRHQAMFEVPTTEAEPGNIAQVAQSGWMLHDRLLTPAMVGVAKAPAEPAAETDETNKSE